MIKDRIQEIINSVIKEFILKEEINEYDQIIKGNGDEELGSMKICLFNNDRLYYTPHCHLLNGRDNVEISLIKFIVINHNNVKTVNLSKMYNRFMQWANKSYENKKRLFALWDENSKESIETFVVRHNMSPNDMDSDTCRYINEKIQERLKLKNNDTNKVRRVFRRKR